jgi:hypothetical protein
LFPYYAEIGEDLELHVLKDIVYILWTYLNWQLFSQDCSIYVKIC